MPRYDKVIFWFKKDLRIDDNQALYEAVSNSKKIIPIFIFVPSLLDRFGRRPDRLGFIVSALRDLETKIKKKGGQLYTFYGEPREIFPEILKISKAQAIFTNQALSFSGEKIEEEVQKICSSFGIQFYKYMGNYLCDIRRLTYQKVFTPFFKEWMKNLDLKSYPTPDHLNTPYLSFPTLEKILPMLKYDENRFFPLDMGFIRLKDFNFRDYEKTRNRLDLDGTSKLSPYIRFGVISLRTIFKRAVEEAGPNCQFIKELAWREFWYHIKHNFPELKNLEFQEKRRNLPWKFDEKMFEAFISGQTGYPIVDAAIRQLKLEGYMHNRARMIVASFLTKDLLIDWRIGEKFFREHLLDYDEVVNTGNWQWVASVGPDPKPFRIFNPILQAQKFDPEAKYIKKYLPELKDVHPYMLHNPLKYKLSYHKPMVNHYEQVKIAKEIFLSTY